MERVTLNSIPLPGWVKFKEGGEAIVYKTLDNTVVKIYRGWKDIRFSDDPEQQQATKVKLEELQTKLLEFPVMPQEVVLPIRLIQTQMGSIYGFEMPFIDSSLSFEKLWNNIQIEEKYEALYELYSLIKKLHRKNIIIGDLVSRDLLWNSKDKKIHMLDADSLQFGKYICKTFTIGYTDPKILKIKKYNNVYQTTMYRMYNKRSDWFSFCAICLDVLLGIGPYGGVYKKNILEERILKNITIFNPEVIYPKTAKKLGNIKRDVLEYLFLVINKKRRIAPNKQLFKIKENNGEDENARQPA